jgi:predicted lysophospholipase L1 biosynthesis ABC-type transport system permease subunit
MMGAFKPLLDIVVSALAIWVVYRGLFSGLDERAEEMRNAGATERAIRYVRWCMAGLFWTLTGVVAWILGEALVRLAVSLGPAW